MRKKVLTIASIISTLLFYAVAGMQNVNIGKAQIPYRSDLEQSIVVHVSSPENNKIYNTDALKLDFNVTVGETTDNSLISKISYETDWQNENNTIFSFDGGFWREPMDQIAYPRTLVQPVGRFSTSVNLTGIPEGIHTVSIYTTMWHYSSIEKRFDFLEYYFAYSDLAKASITSTVSFTIDTTSPVISIFSTQEKYDTSEVSLNFTVNELVSQITYSLDGQDNVTVAGNTTLTELGNGFHNVTVYAMDSAGNIGVSETMCFSVEIPFPTILVIAPVAMVVVVGIGFLIYFKKGRMKSGG